MCDLDGVVYHGPAAIPGAVESLGRLSGTCPVLFATNNASRTPHAVAGHLQELGVAASPEHVVTSSTTGARVLAEALPPGTEVLAVGGEGVSEALRAAGLTPVRPADCAETLPSAVLQGYGPAVTASDLAVASFAIAAGAQWVATNMDATLPTDRGPTPGNGTLVAAVATATGREPESVGKPGPLMYERAAELAGLRSDQMIGIGDRVETDIAGAKAAGMLAASVLTGVHGPSELAVALPQMRPDFVLGDLTDLYVPYHPLEHVGDLAFRCGEAQARWSEGGLQAEGSGLERLRAVLGVLWRGQDEGAVDPETAAQSARSSVDPWSRPGIQNA